MFKQFIIIGLTLFSGSLIAQETWTLERCINQAQENSRIVKQSQIAVKNAELIKKQDDWARYPSVSANTNLGFNFGRSVNPSTYTFENSTTNYNSWGISAGATLYNGGRINNQIKQSAIDIKAAQADLDQSVSTISLSVAQAYLQILLNEEQYENSRKRLQTSQSQLDRIDKQIKAGQLPPNAIYDLQAQAARDEQQIVAAANNVEIGYLNLKNLLEISPETPFKIERPKFVIPTNVNPDGFMFKAIYNQALNNQPQIRAADLRIKSAEMAVKIAQSALLPVLSVSANLNSNYSNTILDFTKAKTVVVPIKQQIIINGQTTEVTILQTQATDAPKKPYVSQLGDNFGQGIGLNLSIPIFSGFSRQIGVQRQKLNVESQMLILDRDKQQLKTDVQNAIANAKSAKKQYEAVQKTFDAQKAAFDAAEKRFQIGTANSFEFAQAKNTLDTAERDLTVSKYDYLFRLKIVEFYEGKKLSLK